MSEARELFNAIMGDIEDRRLIDPESIIKMRSDFNQLHRPDQSARVLAQFIGYVDSHADDSAYCSIDAQRMAIVNNLPLQTMAQKILEIMGNPLPGGVGNETGRIKSSG